MKHIVSNRFTSYRTFIPWRSTCVLSVLVWIAGGSHAVVHGQGGGLGGGLGGFEPKVSYPSNEYYAGLEIYRSGDLENAVEMFESALRRTRKDINGRWIDAIPVYAMLAECYWQFGDLEEARRNAEEALSLAIRYRGWLANVDWESTLRQGAITTPPSWLWPDARAVRRLATSTRVQFRSGQRLTESLIAQGGTIEELNIKVMDVIEIMRGLAIASYRRRAILGPLVEHDPLAANVVDATKFPAELQYPFGKSLIAAMRTVEHFGERNEKRTLGDAANASVFDGAAHPLSALSLLALASAAAGTDQPGGVLPVATNVANVAAALEQPEWIGEAMQIAAGCATKSEAERVRMMSEAMATTMMRRSRLATLHCLVAAADASVTAGQLDAAQSLLEQAMTWSRRRDVLQPRLNAYGAYVAARLAAARGDSVALTGSTDLDKALSDVRNFALNREFKKRPLISIPRLYQMSRVRQAMGASLGGRSSEQLLRLYEQSPTLDVWRRDPVNALAHFMADRSFIYEAQLGLAISESDGMSMLVPADALLRNRFLRRLPLSGRIAQVRAISRLDDSLLDPEVKNFRNGAPASIAKLRQMVLAAAPIETEPLIAHTAQLESAACAIALDRVLIPEVIPPRLGQRLANKPMPPGAAMLTFVAVGNKVIGLMAKGSVVETWQIAGAARLPAEIGKVLKGIGVGKVRGDRLPKDDAWRKDAVTLRRRLLPEDVAALLQDVNELVVIPDGALWYLPLELLPSGDEGSLLLGDQLHVRYAATPGLALQPTALPSTQQRVGVVSEKLFAPRDPNANNELTQSLMDVLDNPLLLDGDTKRPSGLLADTVSHLLVASPRTVNPSSPLLTGLAGYDDATPMGSLAAWMRYPAEVPRSIMLPGFRTAIDGGRVGTGEELFLLTCGLQVAGVRDALVSRWAVGGEATQIAMKELSQELPYEGMIASWKRAKAMLRKSELDPAAQPLLTKADQEREGLTGEEPLFWAGYLVISPLATDPPQPNR